MGRLLLQRSAAEYLPSDHRIPALREAVQGCQGCDLYRNATQAVLGEGPATAKIMFVGEQPGDQEDRQGRPFVGSAGKLFDRLLLKAGISREECYITNAVKHFKSVVRGKRRLHAKPTIIEVRACRPWLEAEIETIAPEMLICLGATAAQSLFGADFRVTQRRGEPFESEWAPWSMGTIHPSAILRAPDDASRHQMEDEFLDDLRVVAGRLRQLSKRRTE